MLQSQLNLKNWLSNANLEIHDTQPSIFREQLMHKSRKGKICAQDIAANDLQNLLAFSSLFFKVTTTAGSGEDFPGDFSSIGQRGQQ